MITKNKEEIEKILKELNKSSIIKSPFLDTELQATIKTSINWCEDEIEFLIKLNNELQKLWKYFKLEKNDELTKRIEQLQSHLKWLKEKNDK